MKKFIRILTEPYPSTVGMAGVIVPTTRMCNDSFSFVSSDALKLHVKPENAFYYDYPMDYIFNNFHGEPKGFEIVPNPFAHWNRLKSVGLYA